MKHHRITHGGTGVCLTCSFRLSSNGTGGSRWLFLGLLGFFALGLLLATFQSLGRLGGLVLLDRREVLGRVKGGGP